jgi:Tol biopolymer transport system component
MLKISTALICAILPAALAACGAAATTDATGSAGSTVSNAVPAIVGLRLNSSGTGTTVATVNADGGSFHSMTTTSVPYGAAEATHGGKFVVFSDGADVDNQRLYVIDDNGSRRQLVGPTSQIASAAAPAFSPDLQWVYFRAVPAGQPGMSAVWRVKLDGSGLERVGAARATGLGAPSISPDGRTLMETTLDSVVFTVLSSGATHGEKVRCLGARYSPDGVHVSCISGTDLVVYDAQFLTSPRTLGDGDYRAGAGTDWSPDGTKILATSATNGPELVSYADGSVVSAKLGTTYVWAAFVK